MQIPLLAIFVVLSFGETALAQTVGDPDSVAAARYIDGQLSDSALNRQDCVTHHFGDCHGGIFIVKGYDLSLVSNASDTVRYAVSFEVAGILAVSEVGPFFMPRSFSDTVELLLVRGHRRWTSHTPEGKPDSTVRTTAAVAKRTFELEPEDLKLLDSATVLRRR